MFEDNTQYTITRFEAMEDSIYQYWDNLDAQERLNWLECYDIPDKQAVIMLPLDEVFPKLSYLDMKCLSEDLLEEIEYHQTLN